MFGTEGILTSDGPKWEHARALMRPQFSRKVITDYSLLEKHFLRLLARVFPDRQKRTVTVDMQPLTFNLMMDYSTEFLMGKSADSLVEEVNKKGNGGEMTMSQAFDVGQEIVAIRLGMGILMSYVLFGL